MFTGKGVLTFFNLTSILNRFGLRRLRHERANFFFLSNPHLPTVLPQNKHTHMMLYNFVSSRPITLVFTHEPRYISQFLWKKN